MCIHSIVIDIRIGISDSISDRMSYGDDNNIVIPISIPIGSK